MSIDLRSNHIVEILFAISIVLVITIVFVTAIRYGRPGDHPAEQDAYKRRRFNFVMTILVTFGLMVFSVTYTSRLFYRVSVDGVIEDGLTKADTFATELENYLGVARSILWSTADTVDIMVKNGDSNERICRYIVDQTANQKDQFDENFTGLYAYVNGEYMDGLEWVPPEDYDATKRDWYKYALEAGGSTVIVPPYVDAQTGEIVITICKHLEEKKDQVVALDMVVNHVQSVVENVNVSGIGYGFVVDNDGLIIAHKDASKNGKNISEVMDGDILNIIKNSKNTQTQVRVDGVLCTLFVEPVIDQWYAVVAVKNDELLADARNQLFVNILVSIIIFSLMSVFYYLGYKSERINSKKIEELNIARQRQEYESKILLQKKESADEANKAKSRFLAQMSHEIRTPINTVLGMNEMILRESKDDDILDYAASIKAAGKMLLALINSILDFSKIEDGKMELVPVEYEVAPMINELVTGIAERAVAKDLRLDVEVDGTIPRKLIGDDVRISQVITNLLTNAVKYTESGGVKFVVKDGGSDGESAKLAVTVSDTGIGIRKEDMDRLFESFERLDTVRNRNIEGTGLGISIVTKLLDMMGSKLEIESEYGKGSTFSFVIEQKIADPTPIGDYDKLVSEMVRKRDNEDTISVPNAVILVVDDNEMNLKVARNLLKLFDITPDLVSSGEKAIEMVSQKTYDIILLDHMMPKMDGIETLNEMKNKSLITKETTVIALTANAVVGSREFYLKSGFDDYISKPIEMGVLKEKLTEYLPRSAYEVSSVKPSSKEEGSQKAEQSREVFEYYPTEEKTDGYDMEKLTLAGINTEAGLHYCVDDLDMYFEILSDFVEDHDKKAGSLNEFLDQENLHDYQVLIHALKNNARTIGADELADLSLELEKAAEANDISAVRLKHEAAMEVYRNLVRTIAEC